MLCQYWAERRRRLLVICPASLRKQWSLELQEKFNLPTVILDGASYRQAQRAGNPDPLSADAVVITSITLQRCRRHPISRQSTTRSLSRSRLPLLQTGVRVHRIVYPSSFPRSRWAPPTG